MAELGPAPQQDQVFRIGFDGTITDEPGFTVVGSAAAGGAVRRIPRAAPTHR